MRSALILMFALPLCAAAADPKPDFTVTAEEFAKEYNADPKAFERKYVGKTVEVSGTVRAIAVPKARVVFRGAKAKPTDALDIAVFSQVKPELEEQLRGIAKEQQVTVRGKCVRSPSAPMMEQCEFVKVGPSTAHPVTVASLTDAFKKTPREADKMYRDKPVVIRVEVGEKATKNMDVTWVLTDPGAKDGAKLVLWANDFYSKEFVAEMNKVKSGDVLVLLAYVVPLDNPIQLRNAVILKEPPAGVKLPGDKK